ncbi:hypothetical protein STRPS_1625 [Streptococcus pseudoporcinus LQ 940-04]|uniref:Uncharacterized protein n=1 Tax=Streptococcus pseudoporcinus LQ 940-04 TaxID=875093 RepID=G5KBA5_9STRE|nr:hypothetical protein HMPREF9320_2024 [Streptococcus pseudoporcinus SPIN 20026]EHI64724.1 hypothetical protein STRPS_1625 [Streptococcus pseudoporcinus LQ 940-04]
MLFVTFPYPFPIKHDEVRPYGLGTHFLHIFHMIKLNNRTLGGGLKFHRYFQ